jgi:hypothetical protein
VKEKKECYLIKITIHSFRRFIYTTICEAVDHRFAEDFLGHSGSGYHTEKESLSVKLESNQVQKLFI